MEKKLKFIITNCDKISQLFDQKEMSGIDFFCLAMLDRLNFSCLSLRVLLRRFDTNSNLEYSCGIIARAVLLDSMITLNVMTKILDEENEEEVTDHCYTWLADSLKHGIDNIGKLYHDKSQKTKRNLINNFVKFNPKLFDEQTINTEKPKLKSRYSRTPKPEELYSNIKKSELSRHSSIYEAYLFYSKYDHFGQLFYEISRKQSDLRIKFLSRSIEHFLYHFYYLILIFQKYNSSSNTLMKIIKKTGKFIEGLNQSEELKKTKQ